MAGGAGHVLSPLRPREFFSRPWSGAGEFVPKLLPNRRSRRFRFRSECEFVSDEEWIVHDTTQFEDGESSLRTMRARLISPDRIETTADTLVVISLVRSRSPMLVAVRRIGRAGTCGAARAGLDRAARRGEHQNGRRLADSRSAEPKLTLPSEGTAYVAGRELLLERRLRFDATSASALQRETQPPGNATGVAVTAASLAPVSRAGLPPRPACRRAGRDSRRRTGRRS